jgi:hypothetical protein
MATDVSEANKSSDPLGALMERRKYKGQSFGSAFKEARAAGDKTFFWNGKKYTTDLAPAKPVPPAGEPGGAFRSRRSPADEDMGREGRRQSVKPAEATGEPGGASRGAGRGYKLSDVERPGTRVRYDNEDTSDMTYKRGGKVKGYASGGSVRGGGCEQRGKTKGRFV